ncbi:MAG TPA: serine hydrolase domain-containing protein [Humisphaera sp.]
MPRLFALLAACAALLLFTARPAAADAIDDFVRDDIARRRVPGVAVAVVKNGETLKLAGYGLADVENDVPVTPKTVFQIQSVTKTMTSAAVLALADEGKLSLGDPVSKHLDGTPDAWKDVTLRHLLSHTSGIKDFINEPTASLRLDVTEEDVLRATAPRPMNFKPGERYQYSNTNYHLLAMIVRKLTGKAYGDVLAERFFAPLGMAQTRVNSLSDIVPHRASGYAWDGKALRHGTYVADPILAYGGGGVVTSAADMATWAKALQAGKVLKPQTLAKAWTPTPLTDGKTSNCGLGWNVGSTNGHRVVSHGGAHMTGFTSHFAHYPDDGLTVVVLTNSRGGDPARIARRIARLVDPKLGPPEATPIEDRDPAVTKLVRQTLEHFAEGLPDEKGFTPELWKLLAGEAARQRAAARERGEIKSVTPIGREEGKGGWRTLHYRVVAANSAARVKAVVNGEGRIAGWWLEEE